MIALVLAGLGEGIIEGLATPFVQDRHLDAPGRYVNITHAFWSVGILATGVGLLLSLGVSWRILTGSVAPLGAAAATLLLLPVSSKQRETTQDSPTKIIQKVKVVLRHPRF